MGVCDGRGCSLWCEGIRAKAVEGAALGARRGLLNRDEGFNGSRLGLLAGDSSPQTKLQLGLGGAEECLVDLGLVRVQRHVGAGAVRVSLEDDLLIFRDLQEAAELSENIAVSIGSGTACSCLRQLELGYDSRELTVAARAARTYLLGEDLSSKVSQRKLELLIVALELELDHDQGVQRDGYVGRHGGRAGRLTV